MKALMTFGFCSLFFLLVSSAHTGTKKNASPPYDDAEGYRVLSSIIDGWSSEWGIGSVSIFNRTISKQSVSSIITDCSGKVPGDFREAILDLENNAETRFRLQQRFTIQKGYRFVSAPVDREKQTSAKNATGIFSVSPVGFDRNRTQAVALGEYLVRTARSPVVGGSSIMYFLRKTEKGWQEAADVQKCGRVY